MVVTKQRKANFGIDPSSFASAIFNRRRFSVFTELLHSYDHWQETVQRSLIDELTPYVKLFSPKFQRIRSAFLGRNPIPTVAAPELFDVLSTKKNPGIVARSYALGLQARGITLRMRECKNTFQHVMTSQQLTHPSLLVDQLLDPSWSYVFAQMREAFCSFGVEPTFIRLNRYRDLVMDWVRTMARDLRPLQRSFSQRMPASCQTTASHIHVPLFYCLLQAVNFPNPNLAFRPFFGAPLVGNFASPALPERYAPVAAFGDFDIRKVAADSRRCCLSVSPQIKSIAGQRKCMEKMRKDFDSKALAGPFKDMPALFQAMEDEIRRNPGFENFKLDTAFVIISPQFSVEELHAFQETDLDNEDLIRDPEMKIRNIWNGKIGPNILAGYFNTYIPSTHADISIIILNWVKLFESHSYLFRFLSWPSDFSAAYRQMPIIPLHIMFAGSCYFDYDDHMAKFAFYRSLPFGSNIAPAGWSEVTFALCYFMAYALLAIVTHCVDDVCNMEAEQTVHSARSAFLEICELLGFKLDFEKSLEPCSILLYLGLQMVMPSRIPNDYRVFSLSIPEMRKRRLVFRLREILTANELSSGDASSTRGRLFFYTSWTQEARSYLVEFAARQYAKDNIRTLTPELVEAIHFFLDLMEDPRFLEGVMPEKRINREQCVMYTDGRLDKTPVVKGVGGVLFSPSSPLPFYFGDRIDPDFQCFDHIAPIEMEAIRQSLLVFESFIRHKALILFVDNTHAIGCLLKKSSSVVQRHPREDQGDETYSHYRNFLRLSDPLKRVMNSLAREIWHIASWLDIVLWIQYVNTKCNIADEPSREIPFPLEGICLDIRAGSASHTYPPSY